MTSRDIKERHNPNETKELDELIINSYDAFVRLERRNLLLISSIIAISGFIDLKPSDASAFGFKFDNLSANAFYFISLLLNLYFMVAYSIYAWPLFRNAHKTHQNIISGSGTLEYERPWYSLKVPNFGSDARYYIWIFVHFILPEVMGTIAFVIGVVKIA